MFCLESAQILPQHVQEHLLSKSNQDYLAGHVRVHDSYWPVGSAQHLPVLAVLQHQELESSVLVLVLVVSGRPSGPVV